jgi:hypothetical protein
MTNTHRCGVQLRRRDWFDCGPLLSVISETILNVFQRGSGSSARHTEAWRRVGVAGRRLGVRPDRVV